VSAQAGEMGLSLWRGRVPLELLGRTSFPAIKSDPYLITLPPYGFYWFQLCEKLDRELETRSAAVEFETLVLTDGWRTLLEGRTRSVLERHVPPSFVSGRRWYAQRGAAAATRVLMTIPLTTRDAELQLAVVEAKTGREAALYLLPLIIRWARLDRVRNDTNALAAVRRGRSEGTLLDAATDQSFI